MTAAEFAAILPALCVLIAAVVAVGADLFLKGSSRPVLAVISLTGLAGAIGLLFHRLMTGMPVDRGFNDGLVLDGLTTFFSLSICVATALMVVASPVDLGRRKVTFGEYYGLMLMATAGMMLLVGSNDFVMLFLNLEILSLAMYVLTGITRRNPRSNEAAIKYLVTGAFSTGFLLFGMAFIYGVTHSINLDGIAKALPQHHGDPLLLVGVALLLVGFGFKVGAVPFHMWVADVYEGAPTTVTAFMSVAVKMASAGALIRVLLSALWTAPELWADLLWGMALLTMIVGNILAIQQTSVKRMLAYSSIAHTGYALVALATLRSPFGTVSTEGATAAVFYLFTYMFMTLGAFVFLVFMGHEVAVPGRSPEWQDAESLDDFAGLASRRPFAALAMTVFLVSLGGIPPTAGFFGKLYLFKAAVGNGQYALAIIGVLASLISMYYYLRVVVYMYMRETVSSDEKPDFTVGMVVAFAVAAVVVVGLQPDVFLSIATRSIQLLHG
jgi:NADH-quinone oxidoreductase subunit N